MKAIPFRAALLDILACPVCHKALDPDRPLTNPGSAPSWLCCRGCGRRYPIEDGIAVMLESRAVAPAQPRDG